MISISLCMIVKDEEKILGRCLDCVKDIADEIIIVDTGSKDSTKSIASQYTDKIYDFEWIDDFSAARNFSFSKASKDYVMWLDADDVILENDKLKLIDLKKTIDFSMDIIMMKYNIAFDKNENPTFSYYRERLFKRSANYKWIDPIHEVIVLSGNINYSNVAISHKKLYRNDPLRNLRIFEKIISEGKVLEPRQQFYYSRELYYNARYDEAIKNFTDFLDSDKGWIENCISACKDLSACYYCINNDKCALQSLFRSFEFDEPRAEICCDIGKHFFDREKYATAIFWYKIALTRNQDDNNTGFILNDCYNYIPYMQICVCYDRLGNIDMAKYYNEQAALIKPNDSSVMHNRKYFMSNSSDKIVS